LNADDPVRSPDNIAPPVVYLASKESSWLNGRVIGASGYRISLYNKPEVIREIASPEPWSIDDAFDHIERSFRPAVEGHGAFDMRRLRDDGKGTK
jgi:hypothetical protein